MRWVGTGIPDDIVMAILDAAIRALGAEHLAQHIHEAPVWVFPVLRNASDSVDPRLGASIYGAVQQLMLAARAYGIGSALTSLYSGHEVDVRKLLGLPDDALTMALPAGSPVAWPLGAAGAPSARRGRALEPLA